MADIIHVITDMGVGGAGIFLSHLLENTPNDLGSLVVLPRGSLLSSRLEDKCIPYLTYSAERERSFSLSDVREIGRILEEHRPSLLVTHASLSARLAARRLSVPALSVRHCDTNIRKSFVPFYNAVTTATIATSLPLARHLEEAKIKNVYAVENGYTDMGVPSVAQRRLAREKFGFPAEKIVIGMSGRLVPVKGHATALLALARLSDLRDRFLLCFLGEGKEEERLRSLSAALGLADHVRFLGFSHDTRPFYHAIDAHLSCSTGSETSSLSLAEGMSAACPTLASNTEGNRARVGCGGCLFPIGDADALAALFRTLAVPEERQRLSDLARSRARALPTWEGVRDSYAAIFKAFR